MTDEDLIARLNNLFWMLEEGGHYTKANTARFASDRIETQAAEIERLRGDLAKAQARIEELEAERDLATVALMHLERCAQVVSERGAVTGPQWMRLTKAILKARSALRKLPNPAPSNEPRLVQSEAALEALTGDNT